MIDKNATPNHIAVIMDGNGRWASQRNLPRSMGHKEGSKTVERLLDFCADVGVHYVTLFCFSSENWKRPESEIKSLFSMLDEYLDKEETSFRKKGINISFSGRLDMLPANIQQKIAKITANNLPKEQEKHHVILAISYGGRDELVDTARKLAEQVKLGALKTEDIDEELFSKNLYLPDIPNPDLVIRTSGEKRISNFLLWQSAYSEYVFIDTLWPDCDKKDFAKALEEYASRQRRFGQI